MIGRNARAVLVGLGTFLTAFFASLVMLGTTGGAGAIETMIVLMLSIVIGVMAGVVSYQNRGQDGP